MGTPRNQGSAIGRAGGGGITECDHGSVCNIKAALSKPLWRPALLRPEWNMVAQAEDAIATGEMGNRTREIRSVFGQIFSRKELPSLNQGLRTNFNGCEACLGWRVELFRCLRQ